MDENAAPGPINSEARIAMAARLGVQGDFVHVSHLARALGISSTTIHAQMRRGVFPMPHRKVGNVVVVKLDDYMRWFEQADAVAEGIRPPAQVPAAAEQDPREEKEPQPRAAADASERRRRAEVKARVQREVLDNMRRKGFKV